MLWGCETTTAVICRDGGTSRMPSIRMSPAAGLLDHVSSNDNLLDLAGAFVQAEQAHVAVEALDAVFRDVAGAAVDLHRAVGHAPAHLGCEQFAARYEDRAGARLRRGSTARRGPARGIGGGGDPPVERNLICEPQLAAVLPGRHQVARLRIVGR